jgi:mannose-1-phosphate guanylyltransferase
MKAMILAAGLGTRLRPLTADRPKALVEINGRTLLEITLARLSTFGICEVIVNVHHFAEMVASYLKANNNFGMKIELSREEVLLDTGGGLKEAGWFFSQDTGSIHEPFVLHNVDVLSNIDLRQMLELHVKKQALATLAVMKRDSSRQLLFNEAGRLCGRQVRGHNAEIVCQAPELEPLAFCGVHLISPRLLAKIPEDGVFSIIDTYLRLAREGEKIQRFRSDEFYWRDLGRLLDLKQASEDYDKKLIS